MTLRQQEACALRRQGLAQREIGALMGITQSRVSALLRLNAGQSFRSAKHLKTEAGKASNREGSRRWREANHVRERIRELEERRKSQHVWAVHIAAIYGALGEKEQALAWFEQAYEERAPLITQPGHSCYPRWTFAKLGDEPSFKELMRRLVEQISSP